MNETYEKARSRRFENRKMMDAIKVERGCALCGYNAHPRALQFDHIDPETKYRTSGGQILHPTNMVHLRQSVILAEIAKCRVLCANCHLIHSAEAGHHMLAHNKNV